MWCEFELELKRNRFVTFLAQTPPAEPSSAPNNDDEEKTFSRFLGTFQTRRDRQLRQQSYGREMVFALHNPHRRHNIGSILENNVAEM